MKFKHVTVAGSGVLGSQIAFQTAFKGFEVAIYDIHEDAIQVAKERIETLKGRYIQDLQATTEALEAAISRITFHTNLQEAVAKTDLVIEAVPEVLAIKEDFYTKLQAVAPSHTVFVSNSSTMIPSQIVGFTGRPEKFLMLHFANEIWLNNTAEIMKHAGTDMEIFQEVIDFATAIGMIALPIYKEQPGYILNALLVPLLDAAEKLLVNEIADVETIDKTWMAATGAPRGPFAILDVVGLRTPYHLAYERGKAGSEIDQKIAAYLKENYIDQGKLGIETGEGFYQYPNPAYADPDFLK